VLKYEGVLCKVVDSSRIEAAKAVELKGQRTGFHKG
ncbi:hypothetical protein Tco_1580674, partial [Tanacetum coccineum]